MQDREPPPFNRPPAPPPAAGQQPSQGYAHQPLRQDGYAAPPPPQGRRSRPRGSGGRPPGPPRRNKRGSWVMKLFVGVAVLLVLIAGGVGIALMTLAPTDLLRDQLISRVKQQTGRDLTLAGGAGLAFWPALGVSLKDVTLSAPPGMEAPPTLVADEIAVRLAIWPLLEGKAVVDSVALNKPIIDLRRDASGRVSWNFASARSGNGVRYAQSQSSAVSDEQSLANIPPRPEGGDFIATLDRLELSEVEITNGTVSYTDAVTGQAETIRAIDATLSARSIRDPMSLNGSLTARATKFNVSADLSPIKPLLEGKAADVDLKLTSVPVQATVAGKLTPLSANLFVGPVSIR
ncbi:MAG: AsmA family protein, partial [Pseudomonadota bacterium]